MPVDVSDGSIVGNGLLERLPDGLVVDGLIVELPS